MDLKPMLFVLVIIAVVGAPLMVEAQLGIGLTRIQGTVFCSVNATIGTNATVTPVFPNATVQLQCGNGNIVSTVTTNNMGFFSIFLNPLQFIQSSLSSNCNVVVMTPLSNCNATLPSIGNLMSPLAFVGSTQQGLGKITDLAPIGFELLP